MRTRRSWIATSSPVSPTRSAGRKLNPAQVENPTIMATDPRITEEGELITRFDPHCVPDEDGKISRKCVRENWDRSYLAKHFWKENYRQPAPFAGHAECEADKPMCEFHRDAAHKDEEPIRHLRDDFLGSFTAESESEDYIYV